MFKIKNSAWTEFICQYSKNEEATYLKNAASWQEYGTAVSCHSDTCIHEQNHWIW